MAVQAYGNVFTYFRHIEYLFSIIPPLAYNAETVRYVIDGADGYVHKTTGLMGTLSVELGTGDIFNKTAYPTDDAVEGGNATSFSPFFYAFHEEQVLVFKLVHLIIPDNTDIDYQMMVVPRKRLCKVPEK